MSAHEDNSNDHDVENLHALGQSINQGEEELQPLPEREAPGWLSFMPPLIQDIWKKQADLVLHNDGSFSVRGFYKNGDLKLVFQDRKGGEKILVAIDKKGQETIIRSFDDLVDINYRWWRQSTTRTNYVVPERPWVDAFSEKKLVKRKVIFIPVDDDEA